MDADKTIKWLNNKSIKTSSQVAFNPTTKYEMFFHEMKLRIKAIVSP